MAQKKYVYLSKAPLIAVMSLMTSVLFAPKAWAQG